MKKPFRCNLRIFQPAPRTRGEVYRRSAARSVLGRLELVDPEGNMFVYTDVGYMRDGDWSVTGEPWQRGVCIVQFNRTCPAGKHQASAGLRSRAVAMGR